MNTVYVNNFGKRRINVNNVIGSTKHQKQIIHYHVNHKSLSNMVWGFMLYGCGVLLLTEKYNEYQLNNEIVVGIFIN